MPPTDDDDGAAIPTGRVEHLPTLGRLLSMNPGLMPPGERPAILGRRRVGVRYMPRRQPQSLLNAEWGTDWFNRRLDPTFGPLPLSAIVCMGIAHNPATGGFA